MTLTMDGKLFLAPLEPEKLKVGPRVYYQDFNEALL